jgi:hypothetical protein
MRWIAIAVLVACACPSKSSQGPGSGSAPPVTGTGCDGIRAKVESLYRAEAQQKEPKRVDEAVADNTAMVMSDCAKAPDKVAPCVAKTDTLAEIEKSCLIPIDEEGTEGDKLK